MNHARFRILLAALLLVAGSLGPPFALAQDDAPAHPLAIHMSQWLVGSREWTTPNPDHDAGNPGSFAEFRVRWDWGLFRQQLLGKLFGVRADGSTLLFWNMYTTHDPGTGQVVFQQIGRNGAYIHGLSPLRTAPLDYGEIERLETAMSSPDGSIRHTRHDNTFRADGTHHADVFEQDEDGQWQLARQWEWRLVGEDEVLGTRL